MKVSATMPPNYRRPHDLAGYRTWLRDAVQSGTQPRIKASAVIMSGRKRSLAAESAASNDGHTSLVVLLGKSDDQNRVFCSQADQHHQTDLGVDIVLDLNHVLLAGKESNYDATQPERSEERRKTMRLAC